MANELYISSSATITPYVILRRKSDGKVWNGSSFVTFTNADVASYDLLLNSQGGDFWTLDFPSGITAAGWYVAIYYDRAGATPAITDTKLREVELYWGGVATSAGGSIPTDAQQVERIKVQIYELNLQIQQASIDDQNVMYRRLKDLTDLLQFFERRAARSANTKPRFATINLSNGI